MFKCQLIASSANIKRKTRVFAFAIPELVSYAAIIELESAIFGSTVKNFYNFDSMGCIGIERKMCWKKNANAWDFKTTELNEDHTTENFKLALIFRHLGPIGIILKLLVLQYCIKSDIKNRNKLNY